MEMKSMEMKKSGKKVSLIAQIYHKNIANQSGAIFYYFAGAN